MGEGALDWDVELPARGAAQRRASLTVSTAEHGDERRSLPVSVGRALARQRREGWEPTCRAELLHRVGAVQRERAHARMEELVGRRDYSARELSERLARDGYPAAVVDELVGRARETGIVDDARYGAALARSKVLAGWGRLRIERELRRRGVEPSEVEGWPEEFCGDASDERERALALASRRRLTGRNDFQRIARFLSSRGFAPYLAADVAREIVRGED
ncbi:regulatory protein RecX [Thermophilibacter sp.]